VTFADPGEYGGQFSDNEGVNAELVIRYQISHPCLKSALAEHLAPNGSIGKNHCSSTRVLFYIRCSLSEREEPPSRFSGNQ
jgi:hypothetical protein